MPPRHGKSEQVSRSLPAMAIGQYPDWSIISTSYGIDLALDFSRDVRNLIATSRFQRLFPGVELSADSKAKNRWHVNGGGGYIAAGIGSAITGRGANLLIIDDPYKSRADAESETIRESTWAWYKATAYSRLEKDGAVIAVQTRWHEDDLGGRLDEAEANGEGDKWERVDFPAIRDPQTGVAVDGEDGIALWPERFPLETLRNIRSVIGERDWWSLYQQKPRPPGGSFYSIDSFLDEGQPIPDDIQHVDEIYAVVDTAMKTGKSNDGVGVVYFARSAYVDPPLMILDWDLKQIDGALLETWLPTVYDYIEQLCAEHSARVGSAGVWIEDKASGIILLQQAAQHGWEAYPIDSKLTSLGKNERAINCSGHIYAGRVKIGRRAFDRTLNYHGSSRNHLLSQILGFDPAIRDMHEDDLLDCTAYGITIGLGHESGF